MKTTPEVEAEIMRLYYAEHWRIGTITKQLDVHGDVVRRVLGLDGSRPPSRLRPRLLDPYCAFIDETLSRYPRLGATRLFDMLRERGYVGSVRTVRDHVAQVRPRPRREVFLRIETMPGEQAQVDWAYVGKLPFPGGERGLWLFVIVLGHSRALWAEFVIDLTVHSLCRSLVRASTALGGVPRPWLFDNPKVVVLERVGTAIRFHPTLIALCGAMRVEPRLCQVARPQDKGKVERAIRYLRDRFLAGRTISTIDDGNRALTRFIADIADRRPHPVLGPRTVGDVLADERPRLLPLPGALLKASRCLFPPSTGTTSRLGTGTGFGTESEPFSATRYRHINERLSQATLAQRGSPTTAPCGSSMALPAWLSMRGPGHDARSSNSPRTA